MRYVVLLRGVNVGGNNRVPNHDLKRILEGLGYTDVLTYINSGNALFSADKDVSSQVIQAALELEFSFIIPILVLSQSDFTHIVKKIPPSWTNDKVDKVDGRKTDVLFLFDKVNSVDILEKLDFNPMIEEMIYVNKAVIYSIYREKQTRSSLQKLIGTKIYQQMTLRNVNTVRKLHELLSKNK